MHEGDVPVFHDVALGHPAEPLEQAPEVPGAAVVGDVGHVQLRAPRSPRLLRFEVAPPPVTPAVRPVVIAVKVVNLSISEHQIDLNN